VIELTPTAASGAEIATDLAISSHTARRLGLLD
jgi:hypothetical protein